MNYSHCFILFYIIFHFWLVNTSKVVPRSHSESIQTPRGAQRWWGRTSSTCDVLFFFYFMFLNMFEYSEFSVLEFNVFSESFPSDLTRKSVDPSLSWARLIRPFWRDAKVQFMIGLFDYFPLLLFLDFIPWWNQILILMRSLIYPLYISYAYYWNY